MNRKALFPATSHLDALLTSGGDDRLSVDESMGLNKYGCSPYPTAVASYSYTTANSISMGAYMHVASIYNELQGLAEDEYYNWATSRFRKIKSKMTKIYEISEDNKFIFGASGTDLELIALWISAVDGRKVHNIIVGAIETGSGIKYVSKGQYYEKRTVLGNRAEIGANVPGFDNLLADCTHVAIRATDGSERSASEVIDNVLEVVKLSFSKNQRPLIHLVHRSKTGLIQPDFEMLMELLAPYNGQYDLVVDACQGRISPAKLKRYLDNRCMVLFTGSKFFGGPPFSGVLMVPRHFVLPEFIDSPKGLAHFFTETEFFDLESTSSLGSSKINLGLILRWEAALYEIERFFSLGQAECTKVVDTFCSAIQKFSSQSKLFRILDSRDLAIKPSQLTSDPLDMDSIYTLQLIPPPEYGVDQEYSIASEVYHSLNQDISRHVPRTDSGVGAFRLRLGQPVKSHPVNGNWKPTLRVSLGAPLIAELNFLDQQAIFNRFMSDFEMLESKTELILRMNAGHW